jgi:hypothetical protein
MKRRVALLLLLCQTSAWSDAIFVGNAEGGVSDFLTLPVELINSNEIVAMQFDLHFNADKISIGSPSPSEQASSHQVDSREIGVGHRRIVVYSLSNQLLPSDAVADLPIQLLEDVPAPGEAITMDRVVLTNRLGQSFVPVINEISLDAWQRTYFTADERANAAIASDTADPDKDGQSNLLEYLTGGNPKSPRASERMSLATSNDGNAGQKFLSLKFRKSKRPTTEVLKIEGSSNLTHWIEPTVTLTPTGVQDATSVEWIAQVVVTGQTKYYLRLTATRQ